MLKNFKGIKYPGRRHCVHTEKDLILKLQAGELTSFGPLYDRFAKPILKFVRRQVQSSDIAEELVQDIFLKVYQYRKSYDPQYEVSKWIWTIARNTVYDHFRQSRPQTLEFQDASGQELNSPHAEFYSTVTAETLIIEEFEKANLMKLMASLSTKQKEVIFLRLVKKFSYQEISKTMNLSLSAVKSLINRAKSTLVKLQVALPET